jgi:hypothetical protein
MTPSVIEPEFGTRARDYPSVFDPSVFDLSMFGEAAAERRG